jgi:K+-transporting ATPase KdpF subunit
VSAENLIGGVLALALLGYLVVALVRPERDRRGGDLRVWSARSS